MTVEVRERSLSIISKVTGLSFANSAYKAFRSISAKHHGNRVVNSPVYSAGNVATDPFIRKPSPPPPFYYAAGDSGWK